jgi:HEAT repeat protein
MPSIRSQFAYLLFLPLGVCGCSQAPSQAPKAADSSAISRVDETATNQADWPNRSAPAESLDPVVQALIEGLGDTDGAVRRQSAEGLLQRRAKAAVPALIKRVADGVWIEKKRFAGTDNSSDPIAGGKEAALHALRQLAPDQVTDALRNAQTSKNAHVRAWATQELSRP